MIPLSFLLAARIHQFMQRVMPSNILIRKLYTRRGLKWGMLSWPLAAVYVVIAHVLGVWAQQPDGPGGWIYVVMLACVWSALKLVWVGPHTVALLIGFRILEYAERKQIMRGRSGLAGSRSR